MLTSLVAVLRTNHQARKWEHHAQLVQVDCRLTDRHAAEGRSHRLMAAHIEITPWHLDVGSKPTMLQVFHCGKRTGLPIQYG
jgi:hypothetical protein